MQALYAKSEHQTMSDINPDYLKYSESDLLDAYSSINPTDYPDRHTKIIERLEEYGYSMTEDGLIKTGERSQEEVAVNQPVAQDEHYIISSWQGLEPLWKAYWINFVFINYAVGNLIERNLPEDLAYQLVALLVLILCLVWTVVSVWRCAKNTSHKYWGYLARFIVIAGPLAGIILEFI